MTTYNSCFCVEIDEHISQDDIENLRTFYTPIAGVWSVSLYSALVDFSKRSNFDNLKRFSFNQFYVHLGITEEKFVEYRKKLEALGLLRTYVSKVKNFVILRIFKPLSSKKFFENAVLSSHLKSKIGDLEFESILEFFTNVSHDKSDFENVTIKYQDAFSFADENETTNFDDYSVEKAIESFDCEKFVKYLAGDYPNFYLRKALKESDFFTANILNKITYYAFVKNDKKLIPNFISTIANDLYFKKELRTFEQVSIHLQNALKYDKSNNKVTYDYDDSEFPMDNNIELSEESYNLNDIFQELRKI